MIGGGGGATVNALLETPVWPPGLVTVTSRLPSAAPAATASVALIWLGETTVTPLTAIPSPTLSCAPAWKLAPATLTDNVSPGAPRSGVTLSTSGRSGTSIASARTTRIRGLVAVPPGRVSSIGRPVCWRATRASVTVAAGAACLMIAKAPATCGAAIDVPSNVA